MVKRAVFMPIFIPVYNLDYPNYSHFSHYFKLFARGCKKPLNPVKVRN